MNDTLVRIEAAFALTRFKIALMAVDSMMSMHAAKLRERAAKRKWHAIRDRYAAALQQLDSGGERTEHPNNPLGNPKE